MPVRSLLFLCLVACDSLGNDLVRKGLPGGGDDTDTAAETGLETGEPDGDDSGGEESGGQETGGGQDTGPDPDDDGSQPLGIDVSHWNGSIDWDSVAAAGVKFSFAKVSEGTYYVDGKFSGEDEGAAAAGLLHGGYHFAIPDDSSGAEQADYFVAYGGDWYDDGTTLPGVLDIEYNPYGDTCYDLSNSEMADWVRDFVDEYKALTGRATIIYSTANWWNTCVGSTAFGSNPMWVAHYGVSSPTIPEGWSGWTFWQYSSTGSVSGIDADTDMDLYIGTITELRDYARGG